MPPPRFFTTASAPHPRNGGKIDLPPDEAHHARRVLRLRTGAPVELGDGAGTVAAGTITASDRDRVSVRIDAIERIERTGPDLAVAFAPPKGRRQAAAVEMLVELGADALLPLRTERGVAGGGDIGKWRARALEAAKQCRRAWLPRIEDPIAAADLAPRLAEWTRAFLASPGEDALPPADALTGVQPADRLLWLVGPEGGFTEAEAARFTEAGARPVRLGPHILRIGTAAAAAAGITRALTLPDRLDQK